MTLTQASAFSLAKAKTVQLISHQFSLLFAPRSLVLFHLLLELFLDFPLLWCLVPSGIDSEFLSSKTFPFIVIAEEPLF